MKRNGFSFLELLIGLSMMGFFGMVIATFLRGQLVTISRLKSSMVMAQIAKNLEEAAGRTDVLAFSVGQSKIAGNIALKNCLGIVSGASCQTLEATKQVGFQLIIPFHSSIESASSLLEKSTIAGTSEFPVTYTLDGTKCTSATQNTAACVIQTYAYFWASCPAALSVAAPPTSASTGRSVATGSFSAQCPQADAIHVRIRVVHTPSGGTQQDSYQLPSIPADAVFYTDVTNRIMSATGAISTSVSSFLSASSATTFSCPINYTLTQVVNGKPKCECMYPFEELETDFITLCTNNVQTCAFNERYRGTDANGTIICVPITCTQQNWGTACSLGGWIQKVIFNGCTTGMCRLSPEGGGCSNQITCTGSIVCCYDTNNS